MKRTWQWRKRARWLFRQAHVCCLILRHAQAPWLGKLVAACTVGYLSSPIQIIPTFIPVVGQLDDALVLLLGMKLLRLVTPESVLRECHKRAHAASFARKRRQNLPSMLKDESAYSRAA